MRFLVVAAIVLAAPATAQHVEPGWTITFERDTFERTVYPIASADDGISGAVHVVCGGADLVPYISTRITEGDAVEFRSGGQIEAFAFHYDDAPHVGAVFRLDGPASAEFLAMFEDAAGEPVAYRTPHNRQGLFTSIGAAEVFAIMRNHCAE